MGLDSFFDRTVGTIRFLFHRSNPFLYIAAGIAECGGYPAEYVIHDRQYFIDREREFRQETRAQDHRNYYNRSVI